MDSEIAAQVLKMLGVLDGKLESLSGRVRRLELRIGGAAAIIWALGQLVGGAVDTAQAHRHQQPAIVRPAPSPRSELP